MTADLFLKLWVCLSPICTIKKPKTSGNEHAYPVSTGPVIDDGEQYGSSLNT